MTLHHVNADQGNLSLMFALDNRKHLMTSIGHPYDNLHFILIDYMKFTLPECIV